MEEPYKASESDGQNGNGHGARNKDLKTDTIGIDKKIVLGKTALAVAAGEADTPGGRPRIGSATSERPSTRSGITEATKKGLHIELKGAGQTGARSEPASPSNVVVDLAWDQAEGRSVSTKRLGGQQTGSKVAEASVDTPPRSLLATTRKIIRQMDKEIRQLSKVVAENNNTKREIKDLALSLRTWTSKLMTDSMQQALLCATPTTDEGIIHNAQQTRTKDIGTQAEYTNTELEEEITSLKAKNTKLQHKISEMEDVLKRQGIIGISGRELEGIKSYEDFTKVQGEKWTEDLYKTAFIATGTPLQAKEADLVVIGEEGEPETNEGIRRACEGRYPELKDLEGKLTTMKNAMTFEKEGITVKKERFIHRVELDGEKDWYEALEDIKGIMQRGKRTKVALYPPANDKEGESTRKMAECIYRNTNIKCIIYCKENGNRPSKKSKRGTQPKAEKANTEAIILTQQGMSYADLLKQVKSKVNADSTAAKGIRNIRKDKGGNMLIVLDRNKKDAIEDLRSKIGGGDMSIRKVGNREEPLYIRDLDAIATKEEVQKALEDELGEEGKNLPLSDLRPYSGESQTITVRATRKAADALIRKGKIRVGLNWCPIVKKVVVMQCFRCMEYGHSKKDCKSHKDYGEACRKCGKAGHKAINCKEREYCLNCKQDGHRAGTGRCPEFRKALKRTRGRERRHW